MSKPSTYPPMKTPRSPPRPLKMPREPLVPKEVERRPIRYDPDFLKIYGSKGK